MIIAIPFEKNGFLNFWKIVKIKDEQYAEAYKLCPDIIKVDGRSNMEDVLRFYKKLALEKQRDLLKESKERAHARLIGDAKRWLKTKIKAAEEEPEATTVL